MRFDKKSAIDGAVIVAAGLMFALGAVFIGYSNGTSKEGPVCSAGAETQRSDTSWKALLLDFWSRIVYRKVKHHIVLHIFLTA